MQENIWFLKIREKTGAIALVLVVMITTLTLVSALAMALINISEMTANYHISEAEKVQTTVDACINDALFNLSSSSNVSGSFSINASTTICTYDIGIAAAGLTTITARATSTGDLGTWHKNIQLQVNVSTSPIMVDSYKDILQ